MAGQRQPTDLVVMKGKKHLTKAEIEARKNAEVVAPNDKVKPPAYLTPEQKKKFRKLSKELLAIKLIANVDCDALARLLIAQDQYIEITDKIRETPLMVDVPVYEIKSSFSTKLNGALSTVGSVMESIRAKFSEKMESAKTAVSNAIDRIKGFFNFEWSLPHLKMPHFSISGSFSLNPPSVPSFGVEWYKTGGIMTSPTVFGMNGTRLMVGGEAGAEAILPLAEFYTELNSMLDRKLKAINQNVNAFIEVHNYIDGDEVASRTTEKVSDNLAIATKKRR